MSEVAKGNLIHTRAVEAEETTVKGRCDATVVARLFTLSENV